MKQDRGFYRVMGTLIIGVIVILLIAGLGGLSGCVSTKKHNRQINQLVKAQDSIRSVGRYEGVVLFKQSPDAAFYCELNYPARVVHDTTEKLKTDTLTIRDTITNSEGQVIIREKTTISEKERRTIEKESTAKLEGEKRLAAIRFDEAQKANEIEKEDLKRKLNEANIMHAKEMKLLKEYLAQSESKRKRNGKQRNVLGGILGGIALYFFWPQIKGLLGGLIGGPWAFILGLFRRKK